MAGIVVVGEFFRHAEVLSYMERGRGQGAVKGIRISMRVPQRLKARRFVGICGIAEAMP
jgi:hypothetical protein